METTFNKTIAEAKGKTQEAYDDYRKLVKWDVDQYLDSGNELKVDLKPLVDFYKQLNEELLRQINGGEIPLTEQNVNQFEKDITALIKVSKSLQEVLEKSPFYPVIKTLVNEFAEQINLLEETVEDFKDKLEFSQDQEIKDLLS